MRKDVPNESSGAEDGIASAPWDIIRAIATVREVESLVRPLGLFTSLTGGVLYKGWSGKDLDIGFALLGGLTREFPHDALAEVLKGIGWKCELDAEALGAIRIAKGEEWTNDVAVWLTPDNRRVDVFCWGGEP